MAIKFWDAETLFSLQNTKPKTKKVHAEHSHNHQGCNHDHDHDHHSSQNHNHHDHHHQLEGDHTNHDNCEVTQERDYWKKQAHEFQNKIEGALEEKKMLLNYLYQFEKNEKLAAEKVKLLQEEISKSNANFSLKEILDCTDLAGTELIVEKSITVENTKSSLYQALATAFERKKYSNITDPKQKRFYLLSLRKLASSLFLQNLEIFSENKEDYLDCVKKIEQEDVDGDHTVLKMFSHFYGTEFCVIDQKSSEKSLISYMSEPKYRVYLIKDHENGETRFDLISAKVKPTSTSQEELKSIFSVSNSFGDEVLNMILDIIKLSEKM